MNAGVRRASEWTETAKKVDRSLNNEEEPDTGRRVGSGGGGRTCTGPEEDVLGEFKDQRAGRCCRGRSERRRARATLGPISQDEELGLYSKAVIQTGAISSSQDIWQCLGAFLAVTTWWQEKLLTSSG